MTDVGGGPDPLWPGDPLLLRYLYADGSVQAALPMRVVVDEPDVLVGWLAPATPIMYWATAEGLDPRSVPLAQRFRVRLSTAPRVWEGPGVLRVMPSGSPYQVIHFWDIDSIERWPEPIGDWTGFRPDPGWTTPALPPDWVSSQR